MPIIENLSEVKPIINGTELYLPVQKAFRIVPQPGIGRKAYVQANKDIYDFNADFLDIVEACTDEQTMGECLRQDELRRGRSNFQLRDDLHLERITPNQLLDRVNQLLKGQSAVGNGAGFLHAAKDVETIIGYTPLRGYVFVTSVKLDTEYEVHRWCVLSQKVSIPGINHKVGLVGINTWKMGTRILSPYNPNIPSVMTLFDQVFEEEQTLS